MFKIEILPFLRCAVECLLNAGSVVWMSSVDHELHCRLIGSVAVKDTKGFLRPVEFSAGNIPTETARVAQPLRFSQIGFAALQFGAITRRRNQTALGSDADGDDNAAAALRATSNVANDFPARQVAVDGEMMLQPFRKCLPCGSPRDFDRGTPVGITQTHKS